jgi:DNA replication protein DnaC
MIDTLAERVLLALQQKLEALVHVAIVGPVGVGKTLLAHALGRIACS